MRRNDGYTVSKRKDGRWMARVQVGFNELGKPKRKCIYGNGRSEVVAAAQELRHHITSGGFAPSTRDTPLSEWLDRWVELYVTEATHASKTIKSYREQIENHIKPSLGRVALRKLTP